MVSSSVPLITSVRLYSAASSPLSSTSGGASSGLVSHPVASKKELMVRISPAFTFIPVLALSLLITCSFYHNKITNTTKKIITSSHILLNKRGASFDAPLEVHLCYAETVNYLLAASTYACQESTIASTASETLASPLMPQIRSGPV